MRSLLPNKFARRIAVEYRCDSCSRLFPVSATDSSSELYPAIPVQVQREFARHTCGSSAVTVNRSLTAAPRFAL